MFILLLFFLKHSYVFILPINVKMPTGFGILTFLPKIYFMLKDVEHDFFKTDLKTIFLIFPLKDMLKVLKRMVSMRLLF